MPTFARCRCVLLCLVALPSSAFTVPADAGATTPTWRLAARVVAVGLPGVAGVRQIGRFHAGGPFTGNPDFLLQTERGRVLDPQRLMVAVGSNFGATPSAAKFAPGTVLSIDPGTAQTIVVDPGFAAAGGQARGSGGAVQVFSAQSDAFGNDRHNASALTARMTSVAGPRYISINNAFGRPWFANAPHGVRGEGTVTVADPDGAPLANAPSDEAGGVFAGSITNRHETTRRFATTLIGKAFNYRSSQQLTPGSLDHAALGTALLGASPDGTGLAVFASVTADGAVQQVHVRDGVDGLAPAGTVLRGNDDGGVIGMAFQWNPQRSLYLADVGRDQIVRLTLDDDRRQFRVTATRRISSPWLHAPVDLAAAMPEIGNPAFASHTTLSGGSDLYVANRGDGSLLRLSQDGSPQARAVVALPDGSVIGADRIRAIAVSADTSRLWITVQGTIDGFAGYEGALLEVRAFDEGGVYGVAQTAVAVASDDALVALGEASFRQVFTRASGLGPLFNAQSCLACHPGPGGASARDEHFVRRVARMDAVTGRVTSVEHPNSPVARRRSSREFGDSAAPLATLPREANLVALRMPIALFTTRAIESVSEASIEAQAVSKGDGIKGRVHYVAGRTGELHPGRYGWKADRATLDEMVAEAFDSELGLTSALAVHPAAAPHDDGRLVRAISAYLRSLPSPAVESSR